MSIFPQAIAQAIYLIYNDNDLSEIAIITIVCGILMIILKLVTFLIDMKEKHCKSVDKFTDKTEVTLLIQENQY